MQLQNARGERFRDGAVYKPVNRFRLVRTVCKDQHFLCVHDIFQPHCERLTGNVLFACKEAGVILL